MSKSTKNAKVAKPVVASPEQAKVAKLRKARVAKQNADTIVVSKGLTTGNGTYVENGAGKNVIIAPWQDKGTTRKLSAVGASYAALVAHLATLEKPKAQLANGITAKDAPQSAAAVRAQSKAQPAKGKGKVRTDKAPKNKAPSRGVARTYKLAGRKDESKPDTFRRYMLSTIMAHKDTDSAKAAHTKSKKYPTHKLDFNWAAQQGYIAFTAK